MKGLKSSVFMLMCLAFIGILAPEISPHKPYKQVLPLSYEAPCLTSPMGRDELGRDILSRVIYGIRTSLAIGVLVVAISIMIGVPVGCISGYAGGITDVIISRIIDILMAFPGLLLSIAIAGVMGPSTVNIIIALTAAGWVGYARYSRAMVMSIKHGDYILASKALAKHGISIFLSDILPNIIEPLIVEASFGIAVVIISEASLSFLGLSSPSTPSLGKMLYEAISVIMVSPWMAIFPGITLTVIVVLFNDIGDKLRAIYER